MGSSASSRETAYAGLVAGLLEARIDPVTERFDAELAAAVDAGTVTPEAARTLRFWQRASLRALVDHGRSVLPPALGALEAARQESLTAVATEQEAWQAARSPLTEGVEPTRPAQPSAPGDQSAESEDAASHPGRPSMPAVTAQDHTRETAAATPAGPPQTAATTPAGPFSTPAATPVASEASWVPAASGTPDWDSPAQPPPPAPAPAAAGSAQTRQLDGDASGDAAAPPSSLEEHRRRLIVAGLRSAVAPSSRT
jgi:hypothetical protein